MCDEAADDSLAALKLITDWFVTSNLKPTLYVDQNILQFNEGSGDVIFNCIGMGILNIDPKNINLDKYFDEDDPDTIIFIRLFGFEY